MMLSFLMRLGLFPLALYLLNTSRVSADCQSYGVDYVDGESYFINTESPDYFSFVTEFEGCTVDDTIKPIVVDPNGDEYFCSDIKTLPNDVYQQSTCNVLDNELFQADMFSGAWIIIIEGLNFAWMREFDIVTGAQSTTTVTPASQVTFNVTTQSTKTQTATSLQTIESTLPADTAMLPSKTAALILTVTPSAATITSTMSLIETIEVPKFTITDVTSAITAACDLLQWDPQADRSLTYRPTKVDLRAKVTGTTEYSPNDNLAGRSIDAPTITVTGSPVIETLTSTITSSPTTITVSSIVTTISIITPQPLAILSGIAQSTVTAPTPTETSYTVTAGTTTMENTITARNTKYTTTTPASADFPCFPFDIPLLEDEVV